MGESPGGNLIGGDVVVEAYEVVVGDGLRVPAYSADGLFPPVSEVTRPQPCFVSRVFPFAARPPEGID